MNTFGLKAMFWKECKENARWAVLALLALSLGLAYAWFHLYQQSSFPTLGQVWSSENLVLTITTPLIGLALGLLQILPELRRDQWAFLVHRPASRTTLFFGKVLPGIILYLLATVLPLLGLSLWAAQPSHVPAPFDFRFTLAGWAAVLSGLPFYFAGLLVALRPARWYGSRALPLLTALLAPWAASTFQEFWSVALVSLLVTAVLFAAAWGSFLTGGDYKEQAKPARFALGLTLYPAVLALGVGTLMLLVAGFHVLEGKSIGADEWWRTDYKIDTQGRIFCISEHGGNLTDMEKKTVTITDLARRPVAPRVWQNLKQQHKLLTLDYLFLRNRTGNESYRYSDPFRYVRNLAGEYSDDLQTYWYYETVSRQIVCYTASHHVVSVRGYLGPNGFGPAREQVGVFAGAGPTDDDFPGLRLLQFPQTLYWYRLFPPAVGVIQTAQSRDGIRGTAILGQGSDRRNSNPKGDLAVAADGHVSIYVRGATPGSLPRKLFTNPIAFDSHSTDGIQIAKMPDGSKFFFWYEAWKGDRENRLITVSSEGRVLKAETLPSPSAAFAAEARKPVPLATYSPALALSPIVVPPVAAFAYFGHIWGWSSAEGFWNSKDIYWLAFLAASISGLLSALLTWLISRRCGDSRRWQIAWALGVFWLGGYGVLLMLALRPWPARVPCPNCGRLRVVDRETCEHCGAPFARPTLDGTEIFDEKNERVPVATG